MDRKIATTIKIEEPLYNQFKHLCVGRKFNLQIFADRCIHLYLSDTAFQNQVDNFHVPFLTHFTGSLQFSSAVNQ